MVDEARRKALRAEYRVAERQRRAAFSPLPQAQLAALTAHVDAMVLSAGCDHTTRHAQAWAASQGLDWNDLEEGLAELGATATARSP